MIKCSPFYENYGYNPAFTLDIRQSGLSTPAVTSFAESLQFLHERLAENIKSAQDHQAKYYNKHKCVEFSVGDKV